jgi:exonuclease SbcD
MRIVHLSDLHLGVENYGTIDPTTGLSTRLIDFLSAFDEAVDFALSENVDLVLLAGDTYKGRDPSQTHQREFARRLNRLSQAGIPAFLLVGNHDLPNASSRANAVEIFPVLEVPNVYIGERLETTVVPTKSGPLQVVAVPWPRRGGILSRDETRGLSIEEVREMIEDRMTRAIITRIEQLDPQVPAILTAHATVNGATVGTERSMMLGQDHTLLAGTLHQPQLEYVALGHIHKHQVLRRDPPMVVYSGSLQRVDFSEEADRKGFCVVELDPAAPQGQRMVDYQFREVQARRFVTVDVNISEGELDPTQAVLYAIAARDVDDAVVRVRISLPAELDPLLREQEIRQALAGAHFIAAINKEVQGTRRTRIASDEAEGLQPLQALKLYLETRSLDESRQQELMRYAEELMQDEGELASGGG